MCSSQTPHAFPEATKIDWLNNEKGKKAPILPIGPEVEASSTSVAQVDQYTEVQAQVLGTRKRKAPIMLRPDLRDSALQHFRSSNELVRCDKIFQALSPSSKMDLNHSAIRVTRRKVGKFKAKSSTHPAWDVIGNENDTTQLQVTKLSFS